MDITISEFIQGAREARGTAVIIDVFRAFSTECYAWDRGIRRLIATATPEQAFDMKRKLNTEAVLAGEQDEKMIPGFDLGNSPTEIITGGIAGRTMIHCTTAGTNGIMAATGAREILCASLVNAAAVAKYIRMSGYPEVNLIAMGYRATEHADEDLLCARYIRDLLEGKETDIARETAELMKGSGKRFFMPENISFSPPTDFFLCTDLNRFNFALKAVVTTAGYAEIIKIDIPN